MKQFCTISVGMVAYLHNLQLLETVRGGGVLHIRVTVTLSASKRDHVGFGVYACSVRGTANPSLSANHHSEITCTVTQQFIPIVEDFE